MKHTALAAGFACAVLTCGAVAKAQTTYSDVTLVFATVDAFDRTHYSGTIQVTGVLQGEAGPTAVLFNRANTPADELSSCERMALLAMSKPGQYLFGLNVEEMTFNGTAYRSLQSCALTRVTR